MTWCITDGVTTYHTISDNAVSEKEKIWRIRAEDTDEKGVRIRQNVRGPYQCCLWNTRLIAWSNSMLN